jgi:2-phosphosulfolactate phosphatase
LIGSFLNLDATAQEVRKLDPENLLVICSGTFEETALEDVLGAGALCDLIWEDFRDRKISDSAIIARQIFERARNNLFQAASESRNGRKLLENPDLRDDVAFCLQRNIFHFTASLRSDGKVLKM